MDSVYQYIIAVVEFGSFTAAAQELFVSQPALSTAIKKLESKIGYKIFNRESRPIELTEVGKILYQYAKRLELMKADLVLELDELIESESGTITIGCTQYLAAYILPEYIRQFLVRFPKVSIRLLEFDSAQLEHVLSENEVDLIFSVQEFDKNKYQAFPAFYDRVLMAVPTAITKTQLQHVNTLNRKDVIETGYAKLKNFKMLKALQQIPFILLTPGNNLYQRCRMLFELEGVFPITVIEAEQLTTAHFLSRSGLGVTFTTDLLIRQVDDRDQLRYLKINDPLMVRKFHIITKKDRFIPKLIYRFIDLFSINSD